MHDDLEKRSTRQLQTLGWVLERLRRHYERPGTEEIGIVKPGLVFHRLRQADRLGRFWKPVRDELLTLEYLTDACHFVSCTFKAAFHETESPVLYAVLPGGHRMTAVRGPNVYYDEIRPDGGVSLIIRQGPEHDEQHELDEWGIDTSSGLGVQSRNLMRGVRRRYPNAQEAIFEAAGAGMPILISGPTGSGKTTLLNRLLMEIDDDIRVVTVQDTPELRVHNANRVNLLTARATDSTSTDAMTSAAIIDAVTRLRPEALLIGEISSKNAATAIEVMGTGHGNFWTSIHAESPAEALEQFAKRVGHSNPEMDRREVIEGLREKMWVIQIGMNNNQRRITHIVEPGGIERRKAA